MLFASSTAFAVGYDLTRASRAEADPEQRGLAHPISAKKKQMWGAVIHCHAGSVSGPWAPG